MIPAFLSFLASLLPAVPVPVLLPTQGVEGPPELLGQTVLQRWFAAALRDLFTLLPLALVPNLLVSPQARELGPLVPLELVPNLPESLSHVWSSAHHNPRISD